MVAWILRFFPHGSERSPRRGGKDEDPKIQKALGGIQHMRNQVVLAAAAFLFAAAPVGNTAPD